MDLKKATDDIFEVQKSIRLLYNPNIDNSIDHHIANYANEIISLINFIKDEAFYKRWIENLEKFLNKKITLDNLVKLRYQDNKDIDILLKEYLKNKSIKNKLKIIERFKLNISKNEAK